MCMNVKSGRHSQDIELAALLIIDIRITQWVKKKNKNKNLNLKALHTSC